MQLCTERLHQVPSFFSSPLQRASCPPQVTTSGIYPIICYQALCFAIDWCSMLLKLPLAASTVHGAPTCSCMHLHTRLFLFFYSFRQACRNSNDAFRVKAAYATSATFDHTRLFIARCVCDAGQSLWIVLLRWAQGSMYIMQCAIKHSTCSRIPSFKLHLELSLQLSHLHHICSSTPSPNNSPHVYSCISCSA